MKFRDATPRDINSIMRLYGFLSDSYSENREALSIALTHQTTMIFVAEEGRKVVGTAAVSFRAVPSAGLVAYIDDVVTDPEFRGKGVGRSLSERCIKEAQEKGCIRVELTSHPSREAANKLYQSMGFKLRETNAYVLVLPKQRA